MKQNHSHTLIQAVVCLLVVGGTSSTVHPRDDPSADDSRPELLMVHPHGRKACAHSSNPLLKEALEKDQIQTWQGFPVSRQARSARIDDDTHPSTIQTRSTTRTQRLSYPNGRRKLGSSSSKKSGKKSSSRRREDDDNDSTVDVTPDDAASRPQSDDPQTTVDNIFNDIDSGTVTTGTRGDTNHFVQPENSLCFQTMLVEIFQFIARTDHMQSSAADEQQLGTTFIYNDPILNQTTREIIDGSFATGHCLRTQRREALENGGTSAGGGYCHMTYTFSSGSKESATLNAAGELFDSFGGSIAITGGTGLYVGARGELKYLPVVVNDDFEFVPSSDDFFTGPTGYTVTGEITIPGACSSSS